MVWGTRGITPLMASVLLVSFAVAVAVVVMNIGRAQVEEAATCAVDIEMQFVDISGLQDICYDGGKKQLKFTVQNGININVEGLIVNVIGEQQAETFELAAFMGRAGTYVGTLPFDKAVAGAIRQVRITPKIAPVDEEVICPEQALVVEKVRFC